MTAPERHVREGLDLTLRAVALHRAGAPFASVLAAVDQAETSLRRERDPMVHRPLLDVCRALTARDRATPAADDVALHRSLRLAAIALGVLGGGTAGPQGND